MDVTAQFKQEVARVSAAHLVADAPKNVEEGSSATTRVLPIIARPGPQQLKDAKNARQAYAEIRARLSAVEAYVNRTYPAYTAVAPLLWSEVRYGLSEGERDAIDDQLAKMVHEASRCIDGLAKITARSSSGHANASSDNHTDSHDSAMSLSSKEQWTGGLPPPSTHGTAKEHARGAVAALLARLAALTDTIAAMQAARYAAAQEVSTTPFSSWLALRVGQSLSSSSKLKNCQDGRSSTPRGFLTGPGSALDRNPPPTSLSSDDSEEELMSRGSRSRKNKNKSSGSGSVGHEGAQLPEDLHAERGGGRHFDRWLLQNMCPPSARQTFGLPDAAPEAISKLVEVGGHEGGRGQAASEAHDSRSNRSRTNSASRGGLDTASNSRTDVVSSSTVVSEPTPEGSSTQRLSRSLMMENTPVRANAVKVNADSTSGFGNGNSAGSTDGGASATTTPISEEVEREEAQMVRQQMIEEHAALESQRAAGDLDAVLRTEEKMRAVAEVMSMFSTKLAEQTEDVGAIFDQTEAVGDDVQQGHEQLLKAAESRRKARRLYVLLTFALSIALLMADAVFD